MLGSIKCMKRNMKCPPNTNRYINKYNETTSKEDRQSKISVVSILIDPLRDSEDTHEQQYYFGNSKSSIINSC